MVCLISIKRLADTATHKEEIKMKKNKKQDLRDRINGMNKGKDSEMVAVQSWIDLVNRLKVLGGLFIGVIIFFTVTGMFEASFESISILILLTLILYLPFRISFSINAAFSTRVIIGLVLFFLMLGISDLNNALFLLIALGAVVIDIGLPLVQYFSATERKRQ